MTSVSGGVERHPVASAIASMSATNLSFPGMGVSSMTSDNNNANDQSNLASNASPGATTEFTESRTVTLEWKITSARAIFESSKGDQKSRCIKSALFDSGRWQIFFYAHNGGPEGYVSVFLSAEPTAAERERGLAERAAGWTETTNGSKKDKEKEGRTRDAKGPWRREGRFKFTFEVKSIDGTRVFKTIEALYHSFSDTARNWGYANFIKRTDLYFNNVHVRSADAFLLSCTIVYSPSPPSQPPSSRLLIPKNLVNAYASLFDDPDYSDVVFRIQRPRDKKERRIYAAKKVLKGRSEYFDSLFSSGFKESDLQTPQSNLSDIEPAESEQSEIMSDGWTSSDDEEDEDLTEDEDETRLGQTSDRLGSDQTDHQQGFDTTADLFSPTVGTRRKSFDDDHSMARPTTPRKTVTDDVVSSDREDDLHETNDGIGFVDATSAPASPVKPVIPTHATSRRRVRPPPRKDDGRRRFEIKVSDASYRTYRALIYYLYTDSILFTPLSSSSMSMQTSNLSSTSSSSAFNYKASSSLSTTKSGMLQPSAPGATALASSPLLLNAANDVRACSAKSIYRIADKLGLTELKERAHENIVLGLNVSNVMYEVCGRFASSFDEIRKVELAYLLQHWPEIRSSAALWHVMSDVRSGKYPGFENVMAQLLPLLTVDLGRQGTDEDR